MRIAIGSDHRGFQLKMRLIEYLSQEGQEVLDLGTNAQECCDYPDFAKAVAECVSRGESDRGILICGTGIGMAIAANKVPGVRAAPVQDELSAEMSRRHNDLNVLCLSADMLGQKNIESMVNIWLKTEFEGGRHARRVSKIAEIEQNNRSQSSP